jgi:hypothetical protein
VVARLEERQVTLPQIGRLHAASVSPGNPPTGAPKGPVGGTVFGLESCAKAAASTAYARARRERSTHGRI